jgi:Homeodomain-like domain
VLKLAECFGVHRHTISAYLEQHGIARRGGRPSFTQADLPDLVELYNQGQSCVAVADRYCVDPATVMRWLKRAGAQLRPRQGGIR